MTDLTLLETISVTNIDNIFGTNGSRLKPNKVVELDKFKIISGVRPVGVEQQITGGILLEGEYNYALYNGVYYFLKKTTVAEENKAGIYAMVKDYWCNGLVRGVKLKGVCNKTDNRKLIVDNLDYVKPLVENPCQLIRVPFYAARSEGAEEIVIKEPKYKPEMLKYYSKEDGDRFYSQIKNREESYYKSPDKTKARSPTIIAGLKPTGVSKFKKKIIDKVTELLDGLNHYYPGRVTAIDNSGFTYNYCLTTNRGRIGQKKGTSLSKHKEYIKIKKLDFSTISDIVPVKLVSFKRQTRTIEDSQDINYKINPLETMYVEIVPRYYLPYFNIFKEAIKNTNPGLAKVIDEYKGDLSQIVKGGDKYLLLDGMPPSRTFIDSSGRRNSDIYMHYGHRLIGFPYPYEGIHRCTADTFNLNDALDKDHLMNFFAGYIELEDTDLEGAHREYSAGVTSPRLRDIFANRAMIEKGSTPVHKNYLTDLTQVVQGPSSETITWRFTGIRAYRSTMDPDKRYTEGTYFFTDRSAKFIQLDEYDMSRADFVHLGDEIPIKANEGKTDIDTGIVLAFTSKGYQFFRVDSKDIIFLIPDNQKIGFPKSKGIDTNDRDALLGSLDIEGHEDTIEQKIYILTPIVDESELKKTEKDRWLEAVRKERATMARLRRLMGVCFNLMSQASLVRWRINEIFGSDGNFLTRPEVSTDDKLYELLFKDELRVEYYTGPIDGPHYVPYQSAGTFGHAFIGFGGLLSTGLGLKDFSTSGYLIFPSIKRFLSIPNMYPVSRLEASDLMDTGQQLGREIERLIHSLRRFGQKEDGFTTQSPKDAAAILENKEKVFKMKLELRDGNAQDLVKYPNEIIDHDDLGYHPGTLQVYDLIGTNYYIVLDLDDVPHLIFKEPLDMEALNYEEYPIENQEIPQTLVDLVSSKNTLRVYNTDFEINEKIRGDDTAGRGSVPTVQIRRFNSVDKYTTLENIYINYQGPKTLIDARIQVPKEMMNFTKVDALAAESLNIELQKGNEQYKEKQIRASHQGDRREQSHYLQRHEHLQSWNKAVVGLLGSIGSGTVKTFDKYTSAGYMVPPEKFSFGLGIATGVGVGAANAIMQSQDGYVKKADMEAGIRLDVYNRAYELFTLDQEHKGQNEEYRLNLFRLGAVYNAADVTDRDLIEQYADHHHLEQPIFINHYKPSNMQRELAESMFNLFGCDCLIDQVVLEIRDDMEPGIGGFVEVLEHFSIKEEVERELIGQLLKNGVKIQRGTEELKTPVSSEEAEMSGVEKAGQLIQMRDDVTKEQLIRLLFKHIDPTKGLQIMREQYNTDAEFVADLPALFPNAGEALNKALAEKIQLSNELKALRESSAAKEAQLISQVETANQELAKARQSAIAELNKLQSRVNKIRNLPKALTLMYKPLFDHVGSVLAGTSQNSRFGAAYGRKNVVSLRFEDGGLLTPRRERPAVGKSSKYAASFAMIMSNENKLIPVRLRQDVSISGAELFADMDWSRTDFMYGKQALNRKEGNHMVDPTRNVLYPSENISNVPILWQDRLVKLTQNTDERLHGDGDEGKFIGMIPDDTQDRYIKIETKADGEKLLSGELFGVTTNP